MEPRPPTRLPNGKRNPDYTKWYFEKNKDAINERVRLRREKNKDAINERVRLRREKNKDAFNEKLRMHRKTEAGRAALKKWNDSEAAKAVSKKYRNSKKYKTARERRAREAGIIPKTHVECVSCKFRKEKSETILERWIHSKRWGPNKGVCPNCQEP